MRRPKKKVAGRNKKKVAGHNNDHEWTANFTNPIVALAILILASLFVMIGAAMFGMDHGFLAGMAKADLARGLITYLFAVVTIGIAVALVLSTLVGPAPTDANDGRFQRAKEILALLLGVFGTIVGFYFGSEKNTKEELYQVSTLDISPQPVGADGIIIIRAVIRGGTPPFHYSLTQGNDVSEIKDLAFDGGWVVKQVQLKTVTQGELDTVRLTVQDSTGKKVEQAAPLRRSTQR